MLWKLLSSPLDRFLPFGLHKVPGSYLVSHDLDFQDAAIVGPLPGYLHAFGELIKAGGCLVRRYDAD
jgi:hypothetical protein